MHATLQKLKKEFSLQASACDSYQRTRASSRCLIKELRERVEQQKERR